MKKGGILVRMLRAAKLEKSLYKDVSSKSSFGKEAVYIVAIAGLANGLGVAAKTERAGSIITGVVLTILAYYLWSWLISFVGNKVFGARAEYDSVRRAIGYAHAPYTLTFFSFLPFVGGLLDVVGGIWLLVAGVAATRHSLNVGTGKAVVVAFIAWVLVSLIAATVFLATPLGRAYF